MASAIIQSSSNIKIKDILIIDWNILFNSKHRVDIDMYFNTDLAVLEANSTISNTMGGYISIFLTDGLNENYDLTPTITRSTDNTDIGSNQLNDNDNDIYVDNNKLSFYFDHSINNASLTENIPNKYYINVVLNENSYSFDTSDSVSSNNISGIGARAIADPNGHIINNTTLDLIGNQNIIVTNPSTSGYYFDNNDSLVFYSINEPSQNGLEGVVNIPSINNDLSVINISTGSGFTTTSTSSFDFTTTGLSQKIDYNIVPNSIAAKVKKRVVSIDEFSNVDVSSITKLSIAQDKAFDSTNISASSIVNDSYNIFIPIMRDVPSDILTVSLNLSNGSVVTTNDPITITNGSANINISYPVSGTVGNIVTGTVSLSTTNGLIINTSLSYTIVA